VSAREIDRWHRQRGFRRIGYHYVIGLDGQIEIGRPESEAGAHVAGHNATTIAVCYVGGVSADDIRIAKDTRTPAQVEAQIKLNYELLGRYPHAKIVGHRDFPGVAKACPCFDVIPWWESVVATPSTVVTTHTVKAGETLWGISRLYGVHVNDIVKANNLTSRDQISIGQVLVLPR